MKALLLAGGHGTRLRPLTFTGNKHMLPIANKPMLSYGLEHIINAGIGEIGIILGPIREGVIEEYGDGSNFGVEITYIEQPDPRGLAHAIMVSQEFLNKEPFVMYLGDNLLKQGVQPQLQIFNETRCDFVGAVTPVIDPSSYGVVVMEGERIKKVVEKPKEYISDLALIGVYVFSECIYEALNHLEPSWRGEYEITDAIQWLLENGGKLTVKRVDGWWKDTGKPEDLLTANQLVLEDMDTHIHGTIDEGVVLENRVNIGKGAHIKGPTRITGPVIIGEGCEIGPETYIGPYTSIGDDCMIQYTEVQNSIIMNGSKIECNRLIVDSIIGRNAQITKNSQELPLGNRFIIGDQSKIKL
jgi:glucose-1-phosphate thymidylyltransferase